MAGNHGLQENEDGEGIWLWLRLHFELSSSRSSVAATPASRFASPTCWSPHRRSSRNALPCCGPGIDYPQAMPLGPRNDMRSSVDPVGLSIS